MTAAARDNLAPPAQCEIPMPRTNAYILVVDDEPEICVQLQEILEDEGYQVTTTHDAKAAEDARRQRKPDLILLDIWLPDSDGILLLKEWSQAKAPPSPVIMMSGHGTLETAVEATRLGAYDFLEKPLSMHKLLVIVRNALESTKLRYDNLNLQQSIYSIGELIGRSKTIQNLCEYVRRIANHDAPALFIGESGTGKEVFARYMHKHSHYADGPFVRIPAVSAKATDLFGSENPGAVHYGAIEQANGGTLFVDEICDLDTDLQARLVGVLQHKSFLRSNGAEAVLFSGRIVGSSRYDLSAATQSGRLRGELYYYLNVLPIQIPPLREHKEDIFALFEHYVSVLTKRESLPYRRLTGSAQHRLRNYSWPGNVRELINVLQRLLILGSGQVIDVQEIDAAIGTPLHSSRNTDPASNKDTVTEYDLPLKEAREQFERIYLARQLRANDGKISRTAERIGIERTYLYRKLRSLGIDPKNIPSDSD